MNTQDEAATLHKLISASEAALQHIADTARGPDDDAAAMAYAALYGRLAFLRARLESVTRRNLAERMAALQMAADALA